MENWIILNKLIILCYVALVYITGRIDGKGSTLEVVLFLLLYVSFNVSIAIFKSRKSKLIFLAASITELILCYLYVSPLFIFFIPINVFEVIEERIRPVFVLAAVMLTVFIVNNSIYNEYGAIALFCYTSYILALRSERKVKSLMESCDELKEKNYSLMVRVNEDIEYKNQIIYASQLEERNKIAQEIHDKLGHSISGSLMQLEAAKLLIEKDSEKSKSIIQNTIVVLRDGMESIRATLKNIKPHSEQLGINKIKLMVNEFKRNSNINASLFYNDDLDMITFEQWKVISENISEALTNTIKYSKASNVKVSIEVLNKYIKTEIKDNGKGTIKIVKGLGLSGIEERTMNVNGKVIIDGSDGFSVIVLLPINS